MTPTPGILHLIAGADSFRRKQAVRETVTRCLQGAEEGLCLDRISGRSLDTEALVTAASTPGFLGMARVVLLEDAEFLDNANEDRLAKTVRALTKQGAEDIAIVLEYRDGKKPPAKLTRLATTKHVFEPMKRSQAQTWLVRYAATRGIPITEEAVSAIIDAVGHEDSGRLANETEKLATLANGAGISKRIVQAATAQSVTPAVYLFYDQVAMRAVGEALPLCRELLTQPDYPTVRLVAGLGTHLMNVAIARAKLDAGMRARDVAGGFGWVGKKYVAQARSWSLAALDNALTLLEEVDRESKTGPQGDRMLVRFLVSVGSLE